MRTSFYVFLGVMMAMTAVQAAPARSGLSLSAANEAVLAAVEHCRKEGYQVAAAVVDDRGVVLSIMRAVAAGPHTVDSSRKKAYTAASLRGSTMTLAKLIADNPELQALRDMNDSILMLGGGLPIRTDDRVVGGIGVGGAPGAHLDERCAAAGLKAAGLSSGDE